jgi:hypothetical protein
MVFSELFLAHGVCQCAFGNSLEQPIVREGERAIGQTSDCASTWMFETQTPSRMLGFW